MLSLLITASFSGAFSLASGPFLAVPPLVSNCWNLRLGLTEGHGGWSLPYKQEMGDRKASGVFPGGSEVKKHQAMQEIWVRSPMQEDPHAAEQLSPGTPTPEPVLQSPGAATTEARVPWSLSSAPRDTTAEGGPRPQSSLHPSRPEKHLCSSADPAQPKIK